MLCRRHPMRCAVQPTPVRLKMPGAKWWWIRPVANCVCIRTENHTWVRQLEGHLFVDDGDAEIVLITPRPRRPTGGFANSGVSGRKRRLVPDLVFNLLRRLTCPTQRRSAIAVGCACPLSIPPKCAFMATTRVSIFRPRSRINPAITSCGCSFSHPVVPCAAGARRPLACWNANRPRRLAIDVPKGKERPADTFPFDDWLQLTR